MNIAIYLLQWTYASESNSIIFIATVFSKSNLTSLKCSCGHVYHFNSASLLIPNYQMGCLRSLLTWHDNFPQKHVKATTFYRECYPLLKMCNFRLRAEGFCIAHPLPAVKLWCFYESDEYLNFWGNYMTLNETKRTSARLKYAGAMKDVMSTAKPVPQVCVSLLFCENFRSPTLIFLWLL